MCPSAVQNMSQGTLPCLAWLIVNQLHSQVCESLITRRHCLTRYKYSLSRLALGSYTCWSSWANMLYVTMHICFFKLCSTALEKRHCYFVSMVVNTENLRLLSNAQDPTSGTLACQKVKTLDKIILRIRRRKEAELWSWILLCRLEPPE